MSPETAALRFHFDYVSSNAYLAWVALEPMAARFGRAIEPVPTLFAGLLEAHGQLGPAEVAPKMRWMGRNNLRKALLLGIELRPPAFHPFNPLLALRASSLAMPADARHRLVTGLFRATFCERRHVQDPAVVAAVAREAGLDGDAIVAAAAEPEAKQRLRAQTDAAIAEGVFGVPTVIADGELFWGYDDFPFLERFLDGRDPLPPAVLHAAPGAQRPSAMRRQHRERPALRLAHVNLAARDPKSLARWYADTFGFQARGAFAWGPMGLLSFEPGDPSHAHPNFHIGFEVQTRTEVAGWARRFDAPLEEEPGYAATRVRDPEGNAIEIYWEPEGPSAPAAGTR
jgi:2-hydroxychromene-2-carboxylate isomerase